MKNCNIGAFVLLMKLLAPKTQSLQGSRLGFAAGEQGATTGFKIEQQEEEEEGDAKSRSKEGTPYAF